MKKFLAVLISLCLLETSVLGSTGLSSRVNNVTEEAGISDALINYGSVTFFENKNSADSLIIIQDLHCHPGVQKNISSAIEYLYTNYKVGNVFVEGAAGDIDLGWLTAINDKLFADKAAESLISRGKLTGAEYFAYKNNLTGILKGIEEKDVHLENLQRLARIVELKPEVSSVLNDMKKELDFVQDANYSAANKKISRLYGKYKAGKIDSEKYYRRLVKISKDIQNGKNSKVFAGFFPGLKDFPEIEKYINFEKSRKNLNVKKAESQLFSVISALKNRLSYSEYAEFVRNTDSFQDINAVCGYISKFEERGLVDLNGLKDLRQVLNNSFAYKDINPISLVRAEKRFLKHLQLAVSESEKEALITVLSELFDNFGDYYKAKLDSEGYVYLKNFGIGNYKKYWKEAVSEKYISYFEQYDALFSKYYDTNLDRDGIFVKFIEKAFNSGSGKGQAFLNTGSYENILSQSKELNIVVCGGFHTYGLINEVKKKDISYIVITPKVEGDVKLSDTIYEDILMSSHTADSYAIALQILSQTGAANQFTEIINSIIHDEILLNPDADLTALINDVVNEVCNTSIPAQELEKNDLRVYDKPVNKGVTVNEDGKVTVNIYFEGSEKTEEIQFSLYGNSASFFGDRFKRSAPLWEWLYMLPFSSILLDSQKMKNVIKSFLTGKDKNIVNVSIRYSNPLKVIDGVASFFLIGAAVASLIVSGPVFFPAVIGFFVSRAFIFAYGHNNVFNKRSGGATVLRIFAGMLFAAPAVLAVLSSASLGTVIFAGIGLNIIIHSLYNKMAPFISVMHFRKNFFFTRADILNALTEFKNHSNDTAARVPRKVRGKFILAANALKYNTDYKTANEALSILMDIAAQYKERANGGKTINIVSKVISSQIGLANDDIRRELMSQNSRLYNYLIILHYRKHPGQLARYVYDKHGQAIQLRLYALLRLKLLGEKIDPAVEAEIIEEARRLISRFDWKKDITENEGWLYNLELQAYVTAVYLVMTNKFGYFIGKENKKIYEAIADARFDVQYYNANASLKFGREFFMDPLNREVFQEIIAHELTHIHLKLKGFNSRKGFWGTKKDIQKAAIHELYADTAGYLMGALTGKDSKYYDMNMGGVAGNKKSFFDEEHYAARIQFEQFLKALREKGIRFDIFLFSQILSEVMDERLSAKGKDKKEFYFKELFFDVYLEYINEYGYDALKYRNLRNNNYISSDSLASGAYPKGSIFGDGYANTAPFWEWVYMLPGVSFFAGSKVFSKLLSKSFLDGLSENRIQSTLKTEKPMKITDIAGVIAASVLIASGFGLAGMGVYLLTRAVLFTGAHKDLTWKDRIFMTVVLFAVPGIFAGAVMLAGFTSFSILPFIIAGIPFNMFFHVVYNKILVPVLSLRNASVVERSFPREGIVEGVKASLSDKLSAAASNIEVRISGLPYFKNSIYEDRIYYDKETNKFVITIRESLVQSLIELPDDERTVFIEKFTGKIAHIFNAEFKEGNEILNSFSVNEEFSIRQMVGEDLFNEFDRLVSNYDIQSYLSDAIKLPSFEDMGDMAENMLASGYPFSKVNSEILEVIAKEAKTGREPSGNDRYKFFEFLGYVLQSQARLAPSEKNAQIGFMQHYGMGYQYERIGAEAVFAEGMLKKLFDRHGFSFFAKSKQAALFDYLIQNTDSFATSFIPASLADESLVFPKNSIYNSEDFLSAERFASKIADANYSRRQIIINCADFENISDVVNTIEEYNKTVSSDERVAEVLFYDADIVDYGLSERGLSFDTAFIFDFSKFTQRLEAGEDVLRLFTSVPAAYVGNNKIVFDAGSRMDSFSLNYMYMLMEGAGRMGTLSAFPSSYDGLERLPQDETIRQYAADYEVLVGRLRTYNDFGSFEKVFYNKIMDAANENLSTLKKHLNGRDIPSGDINSAINDYRTLLNFLFYMRFSISKRDGVPITQYQKKLLSDEYNGIMRKPKNSAGEETAQDTVFVTSGMAAVKSVASFYAAQGIRSVLAGRNIYFEAANLLDEMNAFQIYHIDETDTEGIIHSHKFSRASFIDLVSHSVKSDRWSPFQLEDIIVADIKTIIEETAKTDIKEPFYLTIDNSLYPSFQFADILDGMDLPDNFYIVIYGSMQKMHQKGFDIATSGMITLISNGYRHNEVLASLEAMAEFSSSSVGPYRYFVIDEFVSKQDNLFGYVEALNENAQEFALFMDEIAKIFGSEVSVVHPSMRDSQITQSWKNNESPGIPIFFVRGNTLEFFSPYNFAAPIHKSMQSEGFYDFTSRNSFGFTAFADDIYIHSAVRYNAGTAQGEEKERLVKALVYGMFDFFYNSKGNTEVIGALYNYVSGNSVTNELFKQKIYEYISDEKMLESVSDIDALKVFIMLSKLNMDISENLVLKAEKAMEYSENITEKLSAEQDIYDAASACLSEKVMKDKVSGFSSSGKPLYEHISEIYVHIKNGRADADFIGEVHAYFSNENIINSVNGVDLLKLTLIFGETGRSVPSNLRSRALNFAEALNPDDLSVDESAVFVEAYKYISDDLKRKDIIEWYANIWSGGTSVEMAAAAKSLAFLLGDTPGANDIIERDDVSGSKNYIDGIADILAAA